MCGRYTGVRLLFHKIVLTWYIFPTLMMAAYRGSQDQGSQSRPQDVPAQSWYPPSVVDSPSSSRPSTPGNNSSSSYNLQRPSETPDSGSHVSPAEASGIIFALRDKRLDL